MDLANPPGLPSSENRSAEKKDQEGSTMEGKQGLEMDSRKLDSSWVSVAQDKKNLRKFDVEVIKKEGKHTVEIQDEVLSGSTPLWEDFIVGNFLDLAPHIAKVHIVVNKIWSYRETSSKVDVFDVDATTMRFRVLNPKAQEKIPKNGACEI